MRYLWLADSRANSLNQALAAWLSGAPPSRLQPPTGG
jgi:hypothetical protein